MGSTPLEANDTIATVCVANLPNETSEADIRALFSQYGTAQEVQLFWVEPEQESQGFGYLDLRADEAESAVAGLDGRMLHGSIIRVRQVSGRLLAPQGVMGNADAAKATPCPGDEATKDCLQRRYEVASVEKAVIPDGGQGDNWYRYVLESGRGRITGFHRGTLEEVTAYAISCAADFNLRSATGKSTNALALAYRKKK